MWEIKLTTIKTIGKNNIWIWLGYTPKRTLTCAKLNELKVFRAGRHQPSAGRSVQLLNLTGRWIFRPTRVETVGIVPTDVIITTQQQLVKINDLSDRLEKNIFLTCLHDDKKIPLIYSQKLKSFDFSCCLFILNKWIPFLGDPAIDSCASQMLSERSTNWASTCPPNITSYRGSFYVVQWNVHSYARTSVSNAKALGSSPLLGDNCQSKLYTNQFYLIRSNPNLKANQQYWTQKYEVIFVTFSIIPSCMSKTKSKFNFLDQMTFFQ